MAYAATIEEQLNHYIQHVEIPRYARSYPTAEVSISLNNIASLNYLPECASNNISISNQRNDAAKRTNYLVACSNPTWKSYIPATLSINVQAIKTNSPINRGDTINRQNTSLALVDIVDLRGQAYTMDNPPYGLVAARNIRVNTFITSALTKPALLVKKGDQVLITAKSGSITVKMNGTAMENGSMSQQIRVKNVSSGRIVYAKVVSDGEVLVNY
ncbi:hypothetical protein GCM10027340_05300 [Marinomonas epiphytica]